MNPSLSTDKLKCILYNEILMNMLIDIKAIFKTTVIQLNLQYTLLVIGVLDLLCVNCSTCLLSGFILNYSIYYSINPGLLSGIEILAFYDVTNTLSYLAFYPQIHAHLSREVEVQVGFGLVFTKKKIIPEFVHRVIIETLPNQTL